MGDPDFAEMTNCEVVQFVSAEPDGSYALRILRAYRQRCELRWLTHGLEENRALLYEEMNRQQQQRARELDAAIALLEAAPCRI